MGWHGRLSVACVGIRLFADAVAGGEESPVVRGVATGGAARLFERDEAISVLDGLLAAVRSTAEGRLVLLGGEAGIGKTALLRSFCAQQRPGAQTMWGG
jgi:hypothetical protein